MANMNAVDEVNLLKIIISNCIIFVMYLQDKRTPLLNAVKSGSIEAVDILLTNGARTDVVDKVTT